MVIDHRAEAIDSGIRPLHIDDLPRIDLAQAAATRLLHDPRLTEWLAATSGVLLVRQTGRVPTDRLLRIELAAPGGAIHIAVPAELMPALAVASGNVVQSVLSLLPLIGSRMLGPLLAHLSAAADAIAECGWQAIGITSVRLHSTPVHGTLPLPLALWEWSLRDQCQSCVAVLAIDPGCVTALQQVIACLPVRQRSAAASWRLGSVLRIATHALRTDLLRSLCIGDVVLCKEDTDVDNFKGYLYCGAASGLHWSVAVQISRQKVSLMSQLQTHDGNNDSDLDVPGPPLASHVAALEVPVHFELDNAAMSLAQLSALQPGYVIDLSIPVQDAEIRLVACGQVIGRGRLVVIGDCLGVQIEHVTGGAA